MSGPQARVENDVREALKARDPERTGTLRLLLSEIKNERIRTGEEIDDPTFARLVRRAVKQRQEAAELYRKGGREELATKEEREAEILTGYLPQEIDESEIRRAVEAFVQDEGLSGPRAMGAVMKAMMARFGAAADGSTVSRIAREVLSQ